ncbi:MAG: hypothetical protein MUF15_07030 [Acidobacteria bacterium]|jgi:hypothetical protein|nr:hypothetical protein [Acidobacteriota bacterium]
MKKKYKWYVMLAGTLFSTSLITYLLQVVIFNHVSDTLFYLFQDLAFLPISVLIVTIIIDKLLKRREKRVLHYKLNMVVGNFFLEMGSQFLKLLITFDRNADDLINSLTDKSWSDESAKKFMQQIKNHNYHFELKRSDLPGLKIFLLEKRDNLMRLLENPNLLEHEKFTDLLWAISHLTEELALRKNLGQLHPNDEEHLAGDMKRAFSHVIVQWIDYMNHLKKNYPYMFSLALRNNPFETNPKIEFE